MPRSGQPTNQPQRRRASAAAGLLVMLVVLTACGEAPVREYTAPVGADAEACVEVCRASRFQCRSDAQQEREVCRQRYDYRYARWRQCVTQRGERRCAGMKPYPCPSVAPLLQPCREAYDRCFVGCGGRID